MSYRPAVHGSTCNVAKLPNMKRNSTVCFVWAETCVHCYSNYRQCYKCKYSRQVAFPFFSAMSLTQLALYIYEQAPLQQQHSAMNFKLILVLVCLLMVVSLERPDSRGLRGKVYWWGKTGRINSLTSFFDTEFLTKFYSKKPGYTFYKIYL
jgi:hypothetical protein